MWGTRNPDKNLSCARFFKIMARMNQEQEGNFSTWFLETENRIILYKDKKVHLPLALPTVET